MLGVAVIGCGYWGPNLVRNFVACPETNLVCACDIDADRVRRVLAPYPAVRAETDLAAVLADPQVEAVAIATPVATHYAIARECLLAGRHVLIEKPMTATAAQAAELVRLADDAGLVLMCDHIFCYSGVVRAMKDIIDDGGIGEILYYDSVRINLGLFHSDVNVLYDLAPHDFSVLHYLTGRQPRAVSVHGARHGGWEQEDIAYVSLAFDADFIAHFHLNWLSPVKIRKTIIGGSERMLVWNDLDPAECLKVYDRGVIMDNGGREARDRMLVSYRTGGVSSPHVPMTEALAEVVMEFAASVREKRSPLTDGRDGFAMLCLLEAAQRSLRGGGGWQDIDYDSGEPE